MLRWLAAPHRRRLAGALAVATAAAVPALFAPVLIGHAVDAIRQGDEGGVERDALLLAVIAVVAAPLWFWRTRAVNGLAYTLERDLRGRYFAHLTRMPLAALERHDSGQLLARGTADLRGVRAFFSSGLPLGAQALTTVVFAAVAMLALEPALLAASFVPVAIVMTVAVRRARGGAELAETTRRRLAAVSSEGEQSLSGMAVVRAFGRERDRLDRFRAAVDDSLAANQAVSRRNAAYSTLVGGVPLIGLVLVLLVGGQMAIHGDGLTDGEFVSFYLYYLLLTSPAAAVAQLVVLGQGAVSGGRRLATILDEPQDELADTGVGVGNGGGVALDGVTAAYDDGDPVVDGLHLDAAPGATLALAGGNGSGKSLVLALVKRLYRPRAGSVAVAGADVTGIGHDQLQAAVALAADDDFLFAGSVRDNIAYGRPDATDDDVLRVARAACVDRFAEHMSKGYDSQIGERGRLLSGGQRQRIALARALLVEPHVLLLDNATANLDRATERQVLDAALADARRTVVMTSYRADVLGAADRVALLAGGRVQATGTHDQLLASDAVYRHLVSASPSSDGDSGPAAAAVTPPPTPAAPHPVAAPRAAPPQAAERAPLSPRERRARRLRAIVGLVTPDRRLALGALAASVAATLAALAPPYIAGRAVDDVLGPASAAVLDDLTYVLLATVAVWFASVYLRGVLVARVCQRALARLRVRLFERLQRLPMSFYDHNQSGVLLSRLTNDMEALNALMQNAAAVIVSSVLLIAGTGVAFVVLDPDLALVGYATIPVIWLLSRWLAAARERTGQAAASGLAAITRELLEAIRGMRTIRSFAQEERHRRRFGELNEAERAMLARNATTMGTFSLGVELTIGLAVAAMVLAGGTQAVAGAVAVGTMVSLTTYLRTSLTPIGALATLQGVFSQAVISLDRILDLIDEPPEPGDPDASTAPPAGGVRFDDVWFAYPHGGWVLRGASFDVAEGQTVAVVGTTGAGKSTIVRLLLRFDQPQDGRVLAVGRRDIALVPQEPFLFAGTVADNIGFGRPDATRAEIHAVVRELGADALLERLPRGLDSDVGSGGAALSSGQRQLVALCRALLVAPRLLVLDEATSTVDAHAAVAVRDALARLRSDRTTIMVVHQLETARAADRIVVIDAGRVAEAGTHDELIAAGGAYARLWAAQRS